MGAPPPVWSLGARRSGSRGRLLVSEAFDERDASVERLLTHPEGFGVLGRRVPLVRALQGGELGDDHALSGWPSALDDLGRATSGEVAPAVLGEGSFGEGLVFA